MSFQTFETEEDWNRAKFDVEMEDRRDPSRFRHVSRAERPNYLQGKHFGIPPSVSNTEDSASEEDLWGRKTKRNIPSITKTSAPATANGPAVTTSPARNNPIKIELPIRPRAQNSKAKVPSGVVSARGDLQGACFPEFENPKIRTLEPHPFKAKLAQKERERSIARAIEEEANSPNPILAPLNPDRPYTTMTDAMNDARACIAQPAVSYLPSGHLSPAPMGRFHPSRWQLHNNSSSSLLPTHSNHRTHVSVQSDSQVPRYHLGASHQRSDSEAKRQLQQYQRDMIAQASLGIKHTYRGADKNARSKVPAPSIGPALRNLQQGSSAMKPPSPRLTPMGSPGAITPLALDDNPDGEFCFSPKRRVPKRSQVLDETRRTQSERPR